MIGMNKRYFFRDLSHDENLSNGLSFYAAGIVVDIVDMNGACESGKHLVVEYICPFGSKCREWRSIDSVDLIEAGTYDYAALRDALVDHG